MFEFCIFVQSVNNLLSQSLPTVVTGRNHCIDFPRNATRICVPLNCEWGSLALGMAFAGP